MRVHPPARPSPASPHRLTAACRRLPPLLSARPLLQLKADLQSGHFNLSPREVEQLLEQVGT